MTNLRKTPVLWALTLLLAACGSSTLPSTGGGDNQLPEAGVKLASGASLGSIAYVAPNQSVTFTASDADGSVTKLRWVLDAGQPSERSGEYTGSSIKSKIDFQLPNLNGGSHTLTVTATDDQGGIGTSVTNFKVDASAPVVSSVAINGISAVPGAALTFKSGDSVSLTANAIDSRGAGDLTASTPAIGIYLGETLIKSSTTGAVTADLTSLLNPSTVNLVRIVATDSVGNLSTVRTLTFASAAALTVSLTAPVEDQQVEQLLTLRASATNSSSVSQVEFFVNGSSIGVDTNPADGFSFTWDTSKVANGSAKIYAVVTDIAGNSATSPSVQVTVTNRPKIAINNAIALTNGSADGSANGTITGTVAVNVSATDLGGITQVDLFANDQKVATLTTSPYNFALDSTKYPNGEVVLFARATNTTGQTSDTDKLSLTTQNQVAPLISISNPNNGQVVTSPNMPVQVSLFKRNSSFDIQDGVDSAGNAVKNAITVDLLDYRGQKVDSKTFGIDANNSPVKDDTDGIYITVPFDLSRLPADVYSLRAAANVTLDNSNQVIPLTTTIQITTRSQSSNPPAAVIRTPVQLQNVAVRNPDGTIHKPLPSDQLPVLNRDSSFVVNASDDSNLKYVQIRVVNEDGTPTNAYFLNQQLNTPGPIDLIVPTIDLDGSQYVADNDKNDAGQYLNAYLLRITTEDSDSNRNIQEIWVRVDRNKRQSYNAGDAAFVDHRSSVTGQLSHQGAVWGLNCNLVVTEDPTVPTSVEQLGSCGALTNTSRVVAVTYKDGVVIGTDVFPQFAAGNSPQLQVGFSSAGTYSVDWIVEDSATGVVQRYKGVGKAVKAN